MPDAPQFAGPSAFSGVRNFGTPAQGALYRGAQSGLDGYRRLNHALAVRWCVDLRAEATKQAERDAEDAGLWYVRVGIVDNEAPTADQVAQCLALAGEWRDKGPVFWGCAKGCGRRGTVTCCWRVAACGWTLKDAIAEAQLYRPRLGGLYLPIRALTHAQLAFSRHWCKVSGYPLGEEG